jgi:hypothetical protein
MARRSSQSDPHVLQHPLSYVRWEQGWSHQDLVDRIARRLSNSAARREKAWRWENWGVIPDDDSQAALAAELGVPITVVHSRGWPHWLPVGPRADLESPWNADGALTLLHRTAGSAVLDRRGFLMLGAGMTSALARQWVEVEAPQLLAVLRGGRIDASLVATFEQRLPSLRQMDMALGGGSVRELVDAELRLVTDLLSKGSYSPMLGQRLFCVAAELGRVAGWASFDAGYHAAAERYWVTAVRSAHAGGDRALGANILKCMSLQRVDANRCDEALVLAQAAREGAKDAPARVVAMLTVRQARTHAVRGEAAACERLLSVAERAMERADNDSTPPWASYFDQAEYCAQVAACYLVLQRHAATDRWLQQALQLQPEERSRDRATYLIWRADAVLSLGDLEHACALVGQAVPDIAAARSVRNQRRLSEIHRRLRLHEHPAVSALDEQVRSLIA